MHKPFKPKKRPGRFQANKKHKNSRHPTSEFYKHYNWLMGIQDVQELKQNILKIVKYSKIISKDKEKIIKGLDGLTGLVPVQQFLTNAMLKYQGLGVFQNIKPKKTKYV